MSRNHFHGVYFPIVISANIRLMSYGKNCTGNLELTAGSQNKFRLSSNWGFCYPFPKSIVVSCIVPIHGPRGHSEAFKQWPGVLPF